MSNGDSKCSSNCLHLDLLENNEIAPKDLLQLAFNVSHMGIWEWDLASGVVKLSDKIFEITGFSKVEYDPSISFVRDTMIHDDSRESFAYSITRAINDGVVQNGSYKVNSPTKSFCWIKVNSQVLCDDNDVPKKIVGTLIDVTEEFMLKNVLQVELEYLHTLIEMIPNPIFYKNREGIYKFFNKAFMEYLGKSREELMNKTVYDIAPKDLAEVYHKADLALMENKEFQSYESEVVYADGVRHNVVFNKASHINHSGQCIGLIGIMLDVTKQRKKDDEVRILYSVKDMMIELNQELMNINSFDVLLSKMIKILYQVFNNVDKAIVLSVDDKNNIILLEKDGFSDEFQWPTIFDMNNFFFWHVIGSGFTKAHVVRGIAHQLETFDINLPQLEKLEDGLIMPIYIDKKLSYIIACGTETKDSFNTAEEDVAQYLSQEFATIFRQFDLYQKVLYMSKHDQLTGLYNRHAYEEETKSFFELCKTNEELFHIILFDLNKLKTINDYIGHGAGDDYLVMFSILLKKHLKNAKIIARLGGDEFACVCNQQDMNLVIKQIDKMKVEFNAIVLDINQEQFVYDFACGYSTYPLEGSSLDEIFVLADQRMYKNKGM